MPEEKKKDGSKRLKLGTIIGLLLTALAFDGLQGMLSFVPVAGWIINTLLSMAIFAIFYFWFWLEGVSFNKARGFSIGSGFIVELIPLINALPGWTVSVALTILFTRIKFAEVVSRVISGDFIGAARQIAASDETLNPSVPGSSVQNSNERSGEKGNSEPDGYAERGARIAERRLVRASQRSQQGQNNRAGQTASHASLTGSQRENPPRGQSAYPVRPRLSEEVAPKSAPIETEGDGMRRAS